MISFDYYQILDHLSTNFSIIQTSISKKANSPIKLNKDNLPSPPKILPHALIHTSKTISAYLTRWDQKRLFPARRKISLLENGETRPR